MKVKFSTRYDFFQATLILFFFVSTLFINRSIETISIISIVLILAIYKAFGGQIIIKEQNVSIRHLITFKTVDYCDIRKVSYTTKLYGKSYITIFGSKEKYKGLLNYTEWVNLKNWLESKEIECIENR